MMDERRQDGNCVDCVYSTLLSLPRAGLWHACDYIGVTGKRRPCEAGYNCKVKVDEESEQGRWIIKQKQIWASQDPLWFR